MQIGGFFKTWLKKTVEEEHLRTNKPPSHLRCLAQIKEVSLYQSSLKTISVIVATFKINLTNPFLIPKNFNLFAQFFAYLDPIPNGTNVNLGKRAIRRLKNDVRKPEGSKPYRLNDAGVLNAIKLNLINLLVKDSLLDSDPLGREFENHQLGS